MYSAQKPRRGEAVRKKLGEWFAGAVEVYGKYDPRSLGLARIGLGLLLFYNVWRRLGSLGAFYSNDGLLPNHTVLWRPTIEYMASFFLAASRTEEAAIMMAFCAAVFIAFTIGYRTRFTHVLSFACDERRRRGLERARRVDDVLANGGALFGRRRP